MDGAAEPAADSDNADNSKHSRLAPVESQEEVGNELTHNHYAELKCAVCSQPKPIKCPAIVTPQHGVITCNNDRKYGSNCAFACSNNLLVKGPKYAVCTASSSWHTLPVFSCVKSLVMSTDVYVRWGASTCAETTSSTQQVAAKTLYIGRAVGAHDAQVGGGDNRLCLKRGPAPPAGSCTAHAGQSTGGTRVTVGKAHTLADCERLVRAVRPDANGANLNLAQRKASITGTARIGGDCHAVVGMTGQDNTVSYRSCLFEKQDVGSSVWSVEYDYAGYNNVAGFIEELYDADNYEMPCAVCVRERATGLTVWGTDQCAGDMVHGYEGYAMTSTDTVARRTRHECVEKNMRAVAMTPCAPAQACPSNGSPMTHFTFDSIGEFMIGSKGYTGTNHWTWVNHQLGDHTGVLVRHQDQQSADASTLCRFAPGEGEDSKVKLTMDVLPNKHSFESTFEVLVDTKVYARVTIPGSTDPLFTDCPIELLNGATSNMNAMTTAETYKNIATTQTDIKWTKWVLEFTVPTASAKLTFRHTTTNKASSSDVAIDNLVVMGADCGTHKACKCLPSSPEERALTPSLSRGVNTANAAGSRLTPVETNGALGAAYANNVELTCAQCEVQAANGAVYTRWGRAECPVGQNTIYSGQMAGPNSAATSGGSNHLCLSPIPNRDSASTAHQAGTADVYRVEYGTADSLPMLANLLHYEAVCAICQTTRAWGLTVMGRSDCPNTTHTLDYSGYLMAEKYTGAYRTEHICVDGLAEGISGSGAAATSSTLYPVETDGSLSSSYVDHLEITCAQCSSNAGPAYVRWGRSTCPASATLLYKGRAAGSHHADQGGGHNYVCLHETPRYEMTKSSQLAAGARLSRVEYETNAANSVNMDGLVGLWHLHNSDVPCVVCQATGSVATHMQVSTSVAPCPVGWSTEYTGKRAPCHY